MNKIQNSHFPLPFIRLPYVFHTSSKRLSTAIPLSFPAVRTCGTRSTPVFLYVQFTKMAWKGIMVSVCTGGTHCVAVFLYVQFAKVAWEGKMASVRTGRTHYRAVFLYVQQRSRERDARSGLGMTFYSSVWGRSHWAEGSAGTPNLWPPSAA